MANPRFCVADIQELLSSSFKLCITIRKVQILESHVIIMQNAQAPLQRTVGGPNFFLNQSQTPMRICSQNLISASAPGKVT